MKIHLCDLDFLTKPTPAFDFDNPLVDPLAFGKEMLTTLYKTNGLGLAAPQVGEPIRCFVMKGLEADFVCYNPEITEYSEGTSKRDEGCLSFPGLFMKINRANSIRVKFQAPDGNPVVQTFSGLTAQIVQHEIEHLNGELYFQGVGRTRLDAAIRRARKQGYEYGGKGLMKYA